MSFFPATDLVMDVARAAEPHKVAAATKRLTDIGAQAAPTDFTKFLGPQLTARAGAPQSGSLAPPASPFAKMESALSPAAQAAQKFEAFVLQGWLDAILPKQESGAFGVGAGANIWRGMMAEQLSLQLAKAGALGLHKTMASSVAQLDAAHKATVRL